MGPLARVQGPQRFPLLLVRISSNRRNRIGKNMSISSAASDEAYQAEITGRLSNKPSEVFQHFRTLYRDRIPRTFNRDLNAYATTIGIALSTFQFSGPSGERIFAACDSNGMAKFFQEIIMDPAFFKGPPHYVAQIMAAWGGMLRLSLLDSNRRRSEKLAEMLIDEALPVWGTLWQRREEIETARGASLAEHWIVLECVAILNTQFADFHQSRNRLKAMFETKIPHMGLYLWFHLRGYPKADTVDRVLGPVRSMLENAATALHVFAFLKVAVVDVLGGEPAIKRLLADIDEPSRVNYHLGNRIVLMGQFSRHPEMGRHFGRLRVFHSIANSIRRQRRIGVREDQWVVWLFAATFLEFVVTGLPMYSEIDQGTRQPLEGEDVAFLMARGANLCASGTVGKTPCNPSICANLVKTFIKFVPDSDMYPGDISQLNGSMKKALRNEWYPTLRRLRDARQIPHRSAPAYLELVDAWSQFGTHLGIDEFVERDRLARDVAHMCAWHECEFHTTKSMETMHTCRGCGETRYCGRECQTRDWKEGGHKLRCRRLKS
ncbi:hypothetical protein OF83DRAFT_251498 [Amylostereum chailletii]|nr:hypothetical protein OF83DRAFT_251498 [Amylostereum chailletii]